MDFQTIAVFGASGKIGRRVPGVLHPHGLSVQALVYRTPLESDGQSTETGN